MTQPRRISAHRADRPRVIANFAITFDAKISSREREPSLFSSAQDKRRLLEIRSLGDALLAGAGTVRADNMRMTISSKSLQNARVARGQRPQPLRIIVSNSGGVDPGWKVFKQSRSAGDIHIFSTTRMRREIREQLSKRGHLHLVKTRVDLAGVLKTLRKELGVKTLVCEGGAQLFRSLCELDAVDEVYLTWCPVLLGGADAPTITGVSDDFLQKPLEWKLIGMEPNSAGECFLHYKRRRSR
jgi:5-amino-6-(5-phosphoribosylamino)uracil reductase